MRSTAETIISKVRRKIESGDLRAADETAKHGARWYPFEARLHRLRGVIAGIEDRHRDARVHFLAAFEIDGAAVDAANMVTASLALAEIDHAVGLIKDGMPLFEEDSMRMIAASASEAIRLGLLSLRDLPLEIQIAVKKHEAGR